MGDDDRSAILARRRLMIERALAGLSLLAGCSDSPETKPQPCLSPMRNTAEASSSASAAPPPTPPSATESAAPSASAAESAAPSASASASSKPTAQPQPTPCLSVTPPLPCLTPRRIDR